MTELSISNTICILVPLLVEIFICAYGHGKEDLPQSVHAVEGKQVSLPCDLASPDHNDVYMVLWFQHGSGYPFYSFDVRGKPLSLAHHWSANEVFGTRAFFQTVLDPARLVIQDVQRQDAGVYRCRVDYQDAQTRSFQYNLTVIVPPNVPLIFDKFGKLLNGTVGPLKEGEDISLTCRAIGGHPEPEVLWMVNKKVVDIHCENNAGDVIENRIIWPAATRNDLHSIFTCQAQNSKLAEPKEAAVIVDLILKPLIVTINRTDETLAANRRYVIICESAGSRPPAIITWYKENRQLHETQEISKDNLTISELSFIPDKEDHCKSITCRAENPNITGLFQETSWKMKVYYAPLVQLSLGNTLNAQDIKEGDDVYFECKAKANPPPSRIIWFYNESLLQHNTSNRIIHSNQSLVIQKVNRENTGVYKCSAANSEGETMSDGVHFKVLHVPVCKYNDTVMIGVSKGDEIKIPCGVISDPPVKSYKWKLINSEETEDIHSSRFAETSNGSISILNYSASSQMEFGLLSCWAANSVGEQKKPCSFRIMAAGNPSPVRNCTILKQVANSFEIFCIPGYDGGLQQHFLLEMYTKGSPEPRLNITNWSKPSFLIENFDVDLITKMDIYAVNKKGLSEGVNIVELLYKSILRKRTGSMKTLPSTSILGILIGAVLTVFITTSMLLSRMKMRKNEEKLSASDQPLMEDCVRCNSFGNMNLVKAIISKQKLEKDPDVIPVESKSAVGFPDFQVAPTTMIIDSPGCYTELQISNIFSSSATLLLEQYLEFNNPVVLVGTLSGEPQLNDLLLQSACCSLNGTIIREKLMASRLPESCV